jgi:hypothetical protein
MWGIRVRIPAAEKEPPSHTHPTTPPVTPRRGVDRYGMRGQIATGMAAAVMLHAWAHISAGSAPPLAIARSPRRVHIYAATPASGMHTRSGSRTRGRRAGVRVVPGICSSLLGPLYSELMRF